MKCLVIGAGINGILTAYFLQKAGYAVDVLESEDNVGLRTTFANGCQLSFSHTTPMNINPSFFSTPFYRPIKFNKTEKQWLKNHKSTNNNFDAKFATLMSCSSFSKSAFEEIFLENPNLPDGIGHKSGTVFIFSDAKQIKWRDNHFKTQNQLHNITYQAFSVEKLSEIDDSIASANNIAGGIFTDYDSTLDAHKFTKYMSEVVQNNGGKIIFCKSATNIINNSNKVTEIQTTNGSISGYNEYIYCGGASGLHLLKHFNLNLQAVTGYSLTFDVSYSNHCPRRNIIDFTNKVVYSRHNDILRVAGFFDISTPQNKQTRINKLHKTALERFPILQRQKLLHTWHECRVFSLNEEPVVKKLLQNFTVNTAHGHLGITLSAGSAKKVSMIVQSQY